MAGSSEPVVFCGGLFLTAALVDFLYRLCCFSLLLL